MKFLVASTALAVALGSFAALAAGAADSLAAVKSEVRGPVASGPDQKTETARKSTPATIDVLPVREIVGRDLKDDHGVDAGKIDSLVIDTKNGVVEFVMIAPPGSFNAHGQLIAAPWAALNPPASADGPVTTKLDVDKLAKAPRIDPRLIYELNMPEQRDRMYGYFGYEEPGYSGMVANDRLVGAEETGQNRLGARDRQIAIAHQGAETPPSATKGDPAGASALVVAQDGVIANLEALTTTSTAAMRDSDVYDSKGNDVGGIDETMIGVNRGYVAYVLIAHGGFLGMDENLYAAPIEALSLSPYRGSYRLTVNAKTLNGEPALHVERGELPSRVSAAQLTTLYDRFGVQPYWRQAGQLHSKPAQSKG